MPVTVWENLLYELTEETLYLFQNIYLKNHYGSKLTTTKSTIVSDGGGISYKLPQDALYNYNELDKKLNNRLHLNLCFPEVVAVTLDVFPGCTNKACCKLVAVIPDEATTSCLQCNTIMKVSKCPAFSIARYHLKNMSIH